MFGFLSPLWLAGLTALAVPLALHLWSRRTGRAVRVGSIRLLGGAPPPMARRPRLHDPWLLALRCALLGALVLALARPYWTLRPQAFPAWALVATDVVDHARLVDSLRRSGHPVQPLDPGDLWLSLEIADDTAPPDTRFDVYAAPLLRGTRGTRPTLQSSITWHARPSAGAAGVPAATPPARIITVFADAARHDDARYITAALRAAGLVSGIPAIVTTRAPVSADASSLGSADWIVWLSDEPLARAARARLAAGATVLTESATRAPYQPFPARASGMGQSLGREDGAPVWSDAMGVPLLTVAREGRGLRYRLQSRFAASSNNLLLDPGFPEAVARIWIGADSTARSRDDRQVSLSQVLPAYEKHGGPAAPGAGARSLFWPLWLIAVVLFLAERRIATRSVAR